MICRDSLNVWAWFADGLAKLKLSDIHWDAVAINPWCQLCRSKSRCSCSSQGTGLIWGCCQWYSCPVCQKLTHLSHNVKGHIRRSVIPSHSWQIGYIRPSDPFQGFQSCLTTVDTVSGYWFAASSHTFVALETNLCTQECPGCPPLSPSPHPGPYTWVRQFHPWMQLFQEEDYPFLVTSWVMIRTKGGRYRALYRYVLKMRILDHCWE